MNLLDSFYDTDLFPATSKFFKTHRLVHDKQNGTFLWTQNTDFIVN